MPVVTLRPDADDPGYATWLREPNTSGMSPKLDDSPADDATYIYGPGTQSLAYLNFTTTSLTSTQRVSRVRTRIRARIMNAPTYFEVQLWRPYAANPLRYQIAVTGTTGAFAEYTSPWYDRDNNGEPWIDESYSTSFRQWKIDQVAMRLFEGTTPSNYFRISEAYIDVDVNNQPTVSSVTISGSDSSSRPTVSHVYADTDNDPQAAYHIKVFPQSVYSASGFDAETSTGAVWDSGVRYGSTTSTQVETDLQAGVTYRAYVKAAQSFLGGLWFSTWNNATISLTFSAPTAPTLARTVDSTNARTLLTVVNRANMLSRNDSSLETSAGTWTFLTNCTAARSTVQFLHGAASLLLTATATGTVTAENGNAGSVTGTDRVFAGETYTAIAWFRSGTTARNARVRIGWYNAAGTIISYSASASTATTTTGWTEVIVTATAPSGAVEWAIEVGMPSAVNGNTMYVDRIGFFPGTVTTGGWSPGIGDQVDAASVTVLRYQDVHGKNLLPANIADGGDSLRSTAGFTARDASDLLRTTGVDQYRGQLSIRWAPGSGSSALDMGAANSSPNLDAAPLAAPGRTMVATVWVRSVSGSFSTRLELQPLTASGSASGSAGQSSITAVGTTWTQLTAVVASVPDAAVFFRLSLLNSGSTTTLELLVDHAQVEVVPTATSPATPWEPGSGDRPSTWTAVRGASSLPSLDAYNQTHTVWDHEGPAGRGVRVYQLVSNLTLDDVTTTSSPQLVAAHLVAQPTYWWLKDPDRPERNLQVLVRNNITEATTERVGFFNALGRSSHIAVSAGKSGRAGRMELQARGEAEWNKLLLLLEAPRPLLLQSPSGYSKWVKFEETRDWDRLGHYSSGTADDGALRRTPQLPYREVETPA